MAVNELTLYQIGDIVLKIGEQQWHGYETQMKSTDQRMLYSREFVFGGKPRTPEPRVFTVTGILLDSSNTIPEFVGMYHSLEGVVTDLIAYQLINCCSNPDCCGCSNDWQDVLWWNTVAQIVAIKLSEGEGNTISIAITIKAQTTWTTINRFLWEWTENKNSMRGFEALEAVQPDEIVISQNTSIASFNYIGTDASGIPNFLAQSFIMPRTAQLSRFSFYMDDTPNTLQGRIIWQIRAGDTTNGPIGALYGTGAFFPPAGSFVPVTIDIPNGPVLPFGQTFFLLFFPETPAASTSWGVVVATSNPYINGNVWTRNGYSAAWTAVGSQDLRFEIWADYNYTPELSPYPKIEDVFANDCKTLWARRNLTPDTIVYNPDIWRTVHSSHRHGYPMTGKGTNWENELAMTTVNVNRQIFSVEPSSIYAFTNIIAGTGNILVSVNRFNRNVWRNTRSDTSIDINLLNSDMAAAGYTGLLTSDILVMGDTPIKPGFVIRAGVILPNVTPRINYADSFPGELGPMFNEIRFVVPNKTTWAQLHNFRRL